MILFFDGDYIEKDISDKEGKLVMKSTKTKLNEDDDVIEDEEDIDGCMESFIGDIFDNSVGISSYSQDVGDFIE